MQVFLISSLARQAEFIQQGLRYEGLYVEVIEQMNDDGVHKKVFMGDGLILHGERPEWFKKQAAMYRHFKNVMPIVALAQNPFSGLENLSGEGLLNYFFIRPFPFHRIAAEMKYTIFQQKELADGSTYSHRELELDVTRREVRCKGQSIFLRNKEFALLHFLMLNQGRVLTRSTILENVWDRNAGAMTNTVDVHVSQLRKKISGVADDSYIHTIPCSGYIFR